VTNLGQVLQDGLEYGGVFMADVLMLCSINGDAVTVRVVLTQEAFECLRSFFQRHNIHDNTVHQLIFCSPSTETDEEILQA